MIKIFKLFEEALSKKIKVKDKKSLQYYISHSNNDANLNHLDVSSITNMSWMFSDSKFNKDISNQDVSNVTNMDYMFKGSIFTGDISKWNVSKVTDITNSWMFLGGAFVGDISKWNLPFETIITLGKQIELNNSSNSLSWLEEFKEKKKGSILASKYKF